MGSNELGAINPSGTTIFISGSNVRVYRKKSKRVSHKSKKKRGRYSPHTAGKRRDRSRRRIRYTSKGQPYVIGKNGKARFIKKSSAKRSYKLKGGRY